VSAHVLVALEGLPYPLDVRVRAEVEALVEAGYTVTVAGPTGFADLAREEWIGRVRVLRFRAPPSGSGPLGYVREYALAVPRLARLVRRIHRERPVDLLLVCNPPDLLVGLRWLLSPPRPRVLLDYREISPELFEAKFGTARAPVTWVLRQALLWSERLAMRWSDAVITVSEPCRDLVQQRGGVPRERVFLVGNGPDAKRIYPTPARPELRHGHDHLVLWLGMMSRQEGLHRLIDAADHLVHVRGRSDVGFALVGPGDVRAELRAEVERRRLGGLVHIGDTADDDLVRAYIATADVCVSVDERNAMNDRAAMRKVLEYMAMGRPVVQFPLAEMRRLCGDTTIYAADADACDLARAVDELLDDHAGRARLGEAARRRVHDGLLWHQQKPELLAAARAALGAAG